MSNTNARLAAQSRGGQLSSLPQDYRNGLNALTRMVLRATRTDERTLQPATDATQLMDHIDQLIGRMIVEEQRRMEAREEQRGGDDFWDPETSLLANKATHDLLHFR